MVRQLSTRCCPGHEVDTYLVSCCIHVHVSSSKLPHLYVQAVWEDKMELAGVHNPTDHPMK